MQTASCPAPNMAAGVERQARSRGMIRKAASVNVNDKLTASDWIKELPRHTDPQITRCRERERVGRTCMEHLWSPAGATSSNQRQIARPPKPQKQAKFVAVSCPPLLEPSNGKEGVDGSSPSEGSRKACIGACFRSAGLAEPPMCTGYGAVYGAFRSRTPLLRSLAATFPPHFD
jgi:hypothetical protein